MKNLSFFDKIIFLLNTLFALVLAISLLVPYIPTKYISSLSILSLVVPISVLINANFVVYWLLRRKRNFLLSVSLLVLWYLFLGPFYKFSGQDKVDEKDQRALSIMSFNARSFNKYSWIKDSNIENEIVSFVKQQNPDVICFQEFSMIKKREFKNYPYNYETPGGTKKSYQIIFSKFPIIQGHSLDFPQTNNNTLYVDILFKKDTLRIFNVHLQSFRIVPGLNTIKREQSAKLFERSRQAMLKQYEQANLIRENMEKTHFKKILVGDFNNTQYSNVYQIIKGDMNDSYFEKGKGFGRTYDLLKFPIRIDYILADPEFEVLSHQNFNERLSDHFPVMATLRLDSHQ
ncbi:endonuclease/exonuclease/phosphatase family protein [Flagellimonas pelagia]|uniref:Endonuclease n=1 Tax=Flagellimonas pelagia TaxID=2306998 RepID=A0A3A1NPA4_9FLAO|nr:endonuclease/exonuclease/phosphatase family protein [Allomuricauda maritima]RIV45251.1 endonuclease [Allomuricauda maritima]TXJ96724.1 endonuclease/exonuclease/phosphatase family protein [Allomuricauda maritima]